MKPKTIKAWGVQARLNNKCKWAWTWLYGTQSEIAEYAFFRTRDDAKFRADVLRKSGEQIRVVRVELPEPKP